MNENTENRSKDGIVELRNGKYRATVWTVSPHGKRVKKEKTFRTRQAAKEWRTNEKSAVHRGESTIGKSKLTVGQMGVKWMAHREDWVRTKYPKASPAEIKDRLSRHRTSLISFGKVLGTEFLVTNIKRSDGDSYKRFRIEKGVKPATINRELEVLAQAMKWAVEEFGLRRVYEPPSFLKFPEPSHGRERVFSLAEEKMVLDYLLANGFQDAADFFVLCIDTAMRRKEVYNLKWATNVMLEHDNFAGNGAIEARSIKTGQAKTIPMTARVRNILLRRRLATGGSEGVFGGDVQLWAIRGQIKQAVKGSGLKWGRGVENGLVIHDLRRTAINRMLIRTNYDYVTVERIAGISLMVLLKSYARTDSDKMMAALGIEVDVQAVAVGQGR